MKNFMRKKKYMVGIAIIAVVAVGAGVVVNRVHQKQNQTEWIAYEDLTQQQQQNLHYLFGRETAEKCSSVSADDTLLNDEEAYAGFTYSLDANYDKKNISYGPVKEGDNISGILSRNDIIERAKKEVELNYDEIEVAKDETAQKWQIRFSTTEEEQYVYLYYDGTVHMVTTVMPVTEETTASGNAI
jgi:signal-transduction protein with cAMP-binding, CBS, and nucleotidyltransferase domain